MGLLRNLRLLATTDLPERMLSLERRQDLLEDYTDQKLDSMKMYAARVGKRERDRVAGSRLNDQEGMRVVEAPKTDSRVAGLLARRNRRYGNLAG